MEFFIYFDGLRIENNAVLRVERERHKECYVIDLD
jgi:hypothetical protein